MKIPIFEPADAVLSGETADIYFARTMDIITFRPRLLAAFPLP